MLKHLLAYFVIFCFCQQPVRSITAEEHKLHIKFPLGSYKLAVSGKVDFKKDNETSSSTFTKDFWNVSTPTKEHPEKLLFELENKVMKYKDKSIDISYNNRLLAFSLDGESISELTKSQSRLIGPKNGTAVEVFLHNDFQEIKSTKVIKHGKPEDSFPDGYYDSIYFFLLSNIHTLLPEKEIAIGDKWNRPYELVTSLGTIPVNLSLSFEKTEGSDIGKLAVIEIAADFSEKDKLDFNMGDVMSLSYHDVNVVSAGKIMFDISSGVPVFYEIKTELNARPAYNRKIKFDIQNEFKYEWTYSPGAGVVVQPVSSAPNPQVSDAISGGNSEVEQIDTKKSVDNLDEK